MEIGVHVWIRDDSGDQSWLPAIVTSRELSVDNTTISVRCISSGDVKTYRVGAAESDHPDVKLGNDDASATIDNLISLPHLHEPAILHCLEERYNECRIYTFTGPILIAVNPFKAVGLYSQSILEAYYNAGLLRAQGIQPAGSTSPSLPPHIYAIADAAYRNVMTAIMQHPNASTASSGGPSKCNQTILISGESGAGKTESTKIVLRYLTTVGNSTSGLQCSTGSVMDRILQSNPILESFGNARTLRNDNSSRFGKFIELKFSRRGQLVGGTIRTYLLEKVRLTAQQRGERNFHIFYQLLAGCGESDREEWQLKEPQHYTYTNQGGVYGLRLVDDAEEFANLNRALDVLMFDSESQKCLLGVVAGLLHLGQISFVDIPDVIDCCRVSEDHEVQSHLAMASKLFGTCKEELEVALTRRAITARHETVVKTLNCSQAADARDALARSIYDNVFLFIVSSINKSIQVDASVVRAEIGVLDIFGFECFQQNSFEQLCINYTNEALQQQFNQFIFKMEQAEYQREQIQWSFIQFPDNQDCLDLIDHKQNGILSMLDDECKLPRATDDKFAKRLYKALDTHTRFSASVTQKRDGKFAIMHYAGQVQYDTLGFIEKNKDDLPRESLALLRNSSVSLLSQAFAEKETTTAAAAAFAKTGSAQLISVGSQFKSQLAKLMEKINTTTPHYIRCLKPNDENLPDKFNRLRATEQLRYGGVLEAVRVARSGFPVRLSHSEFFSRYRSLAKLPPQAAAAVQHCHKMLDTLTRAAIDDDQNVGSGSKIKFEDGSAQIGITKVFLRKSAHDALECHRSRELFLNARKIQAIYRCCRQRRWFAAVKVVAHTLQRFVRGILARAAVAKLRRLKATVKLQKWLRCRSAVRSYVRFLRSLIVLQSKFRSKKARLLLQDLRYHARAKTVQRIIRGFFSRYRYVCFRNAVISLQCAARCRRARVRLQSLRLEARDLGCLKQSNDQLKEEIVQLRRQAQEEARRLQREAEQRATAAMEDEITRLKAELAIAKEELRQERQLRQLVEQQKKVYEQNLNELDMSPKRTLSLSPLRGGGRTPRSRRLRAVTDCSVAGLGNNNEVYTDQNNLNSPQKLVPTNNSPLRAVRKTLLPYQLPSPHKVGASVICLEEKVLEGDSSPSRSTGDLELSYQLEREREARQSLEGEVLALRLKLDIAAGAAAESMNNKAEIIVSETTADHENLVKQPPSSSSSYEEEGNYSYPAQPQGLLALRKFNEYVVQFNQRMHGGVHAAVREQKDCVGQCQLEKLPWLECEITLDSQNNIHFTTSRRTFAIFSTKRELAPLRLADIVECQAGGSDWLGQHEQDDNDRVLVILASDSVAEDTLNPFRRIFLKFSKQEEMSELLIGLRTIVADLHLQIRRGDSASGSFGLNQNAQTRKDQFPRRKKFFSPFNQTAATSQKQPDSAPGKPSVAVDMKRNGSSADDSTWDASESAREMTSLRRQLQLERANYEKLMTQTLALTNDLNEREAQIIDFRKRETALRETLAMNEKLYQEDSQIRLALGKRLEQVLIDKEEALEQLDLMQEKLETIKSAMAMSDYSPAKKS